jgi:plastocyanin
MRHVSLTHALAAALLLAACDNTNGVNGTIELRDDCDPATFNAGLGAGTCQHRSTAAGVTLASFNSELTATGHVAAWQIFPSTLDVSEGDRFTLANTGGETHTYTEVENFGGGVVPALNTASGNTTVAPECANAATFGSSTLVSGGVATHTFDEAGTEKYQCCIHPWMRQTVTVH